MWSTNFITQCICCFILLVGGDTRPSQASGTNDPDPTAFPPFRGEGIVAENVNEIAYDSNGGHSLVRGAGVQGI